MTIDFSFEITSPITQTGKFYLGKSDYKVWLFNCKFKMAEENLLSTSHKGEKLRSYITDFKLEVVRFAELNGNRAAERKYKVDRKSVLEWRGKQQKFEELRKSTNAGAKRQHLDGGGRKVTDSELEERLLEWVFDRRDKGFRVSRKLIQLKAREFQNENSAIDNGRTELIFSNGWVQKFMAKNGLSIRRRTTQAQKSPKQLIDKLCTYVLKIRRLRNQMNYDLSNIIAMDETAVWNDMISNTTVEKTWCAFSQLEDNWT